MLGLLCWLEFHQSNLTINFSTRFSEIFPRQLSKNKITAAAAATTTTATLCAFDAPARTRCKISCRRRFSALSIAGVFRRRTGNERLQSSSAHAKRVLEYITDTGRSQRWSSAWTKTSVVNRTTSSSGWRQRRRFCRQRGKGSTRIGLALANVVGWSRVVDFSANLEFW